MYARASGEAFAASRSNHSLLSGTSFLVCGVDLVHVADLVGLELQPGGQKTLDVKGVFLVVVSQIDVVGVLGDVVLVGQKGPDAPELEDALAAVQHGQLVHAGKVFATMSSDEFEIGKKTTLLG